MQDPNKKQRISDAIDKMVAQGAPDSAIETVVQSIMSEPDGQFSDVESGASTSKGKAPRGASLAPIASGLTLGASDEILGGIEGLNSKLHGGSFSEGYERGKAKTREVGNEFRDEHPVLSPTLEIAAGLAAPGFGAAKFVGKGASTAAKIGRGMISGAGIGAGAGALSSTEGNRTGGAIAGGVGGGVLGGAIPAAGATVSEVLNQLGARSAKGIDRQALLKIAQAAARDGKTVSQLLSEGQSFGDKPAIVADLLGENGLGLTRAVAGVPGKGKQALSDILHGRQEGQLGRVIGDIENRLGMKGRDVYDVADELITKQKANAKPLYDAAKPLPIQNPETQKEIISLLDLPEFKQAFKRGGKIAAVERNPLQGDTPLTVGDIDYMKRGLDAVIESRSSGKNAISKTEGRALRNRLNELLDMVDAEHPEYAQARQQFAGDARLRDALEEGKNFLNEDHQITAKQLQRMSPSEQEMYRVGAIGALRRLGEKTPENMDKVRRIFGNPEAKARLNALLSDPEAFAGLSEDMAKEAQLVQTKNGALVGSRTTPMALEMGDLFSTAANAATGNIGGLAKQGVKAILSNRAKVGSEKIANAISQKLQVKPGTPEFQLLMDELAKLEVQKSPNARRLLPSVSLRNRTGAIGEQPGPVFREMSPSKALAFVDRNTMEDTKIPLHFASSPELATGQGMNRGVMVELEGAPLDLTRKTSKPGLAYSESNGAAELIGANNPQSRYQDAVRAVTVDLNAIRRDAYGRRLLGVLKQLESEGWKSEQQPDGKMRLLPPNIKAGHSGLKMLGAISGTGAAAAGLGALHGRMKRVQK